MSTDKESSAAGTDNRPPMLVESDYDSWKIRIHRYIRGKPLGKLIWNSIQNGPSPHPMVTDAPTEGQTGVNMPRMKLDSEFTPEETNCENADTQAEIIPFMTLQQRKEDLFDEFERFRAIGNEPIHDYFLNTSLCPTTFLSYAVTYETNVKQTWTFQQQTYVPIYTHLKAYEPHATKTLKKQEQSSSIIDSLAYMAQATPTTSLPPLSTSQPQPAVLSPNDAMMATMTQMIKSTFKWYSPEVSFLLPISAQFTPTRVHMLRFMTAKLLLTRQEKATRECLKHRPRGNQSYGAKDSQYFKRQDAAHRKQSKGVTLDAEAEAFLANVECTAPYDQPLAMATTNIFEVNHEDAYDSDVDEGPNAAAAFMANLSSTKQSDSDVESELDDNTTPYHQLELERRAKVVPTEEIVRLEPNMKLDLRTPSYTGTKPSDSAITKKRLNISKRKTPKCITGLAQDILVDRYVLNERKSQARLDPNGFYEKLKCLQVSFHSRTVLENSAVTSNAIFEINKLRDQLQGKDATIQENLDAQINIRRIQLDGLKVENVSLKRRYDELSKANTHSRTAYTEKLSALTAEHTKLQAQVTGKTSSGPSTSETPKVLAPGMYNLGSKYIPPPKRANWVKSTQLPKTKQVTFIEPPRPSLKPTQKLVVHHNKQTNVCVPMPTGVKPTSGASKPVPKRAPQNHSSLPAKSANARRVEAHHRTLNKKNRVDSNLLVKHSVFVSNSNNDCGACNKSLFFSNHNACLVMCDDSVNDKPHPTKRSTRQPTKEWKPINKVGKPIKRVWNSISKNIANTKPQWKPTGRHL
ncbi:hypothetical protein Tco_1300605 [Tanacetum coccineum]